MEWNDALIDGLDLALNESDVRGLRFFAESGVAHLFVEVVALPTVGPIDRDPRRLIVLSGVYSIEVVLRTDRITDTPYGPGLPLADLDEVDQVFATAAWAHSMYGWTFIDTEHFRDAWPYEPSLTIRLRSTGDLPVHSLHWFTECGVPQGDSTQAMCLEGVIYFDTLGVERADGTTVPVPDFIDDSRRWWTAFKDHDERLSLASQREFGSSALRWRATTNAIEQTPQ